MSSSRSGRASGGPLLVAVDAGTTGARAVAVDLEGRVVAEVRRPYPLTVPRPGWAEQDPMDWADQAVQALAGLARRVRRPQRVLAIGLTGQCPTVAPFDRRGRPTGPGMLYRDNRAAAEALLMREQLGIDEVHRRTGHTPEAFHVGPKVLWLRRHRPDVFDRTTTFLQPRDVVLRRLTGHTLTDHSHANATLFFDLLPRKWALDLLGAFGLDPGIFPEAVAPWAVVGKLRTPMVTEAGLPRVPVVVGAGDSQCVAFGAGVLEPGPVSEMAGASTCLNSSVSRPVRDVRVTHYNHVVPDRFTTEIGLNSTGAAVDWALSTLAYRGYEEMAADVERFRRRWKRARGSPGDDLETAPLFLPYLADGERDDPGIRAAFLGLSSRHDRAALAYGVLEGIALGVRAKLRLLSDAGCPIDELRVAGGLARNASLGRLKADALCVPVLHLDADAAAVGAALLAGESVGIDAATVVKEVLSRARRFEPGEWGSEVLARRGARFDETIVARAVRTGTDR